MTPFIDAHTHVTPLALPEAPRAEIQPRWPCMRCNMPDSATVMIGDKAFRELDARSWDVARRLDDMDRDGVAMQILSPMPELLSYWIAPGDAALICDASNAQIAEMIARAPRRFRGLGAVPMQDPDSAIAGLRRLRREFGLSGVEIGSNIDGVMLGEPCFDPIWAAAEEEDLAVFVHALHPVAAKPIAASPLYTALTLFPIDVAMAAASLAMAGVPDRFPGLRIGFSHGGGALGAILGRLDIGWERTEGFGGRAAARPSEGARNFFYDSNVYAAAYLRHLAEAVAPGRVFAGTDYPYDIMQRDPRGFVAAAALDEQAAADIAIEAVSAFIAEDLRAVVQGHDSGSARA